MKKTMNKIKMISFHLINLTWNISKYSSNSLQHPFKRPWNIFDDSSIKLQKLTKNILNNFTVLCRKILTLIQLVSPLRLGYHLPNLHIQIRKRISTHIINFEEYLSKLISKTLMLKKLFLFPKELNTLQYNYRRYTIKNDVVAVVYIVSYFRFLKLWINFMEELYSR